MDGGAPLTSQTQSDVGDADVYGTQLKASAQRMSILLDPTCTPAAKRDAIYAIYNELIVPATKNDNPDVSVKTLNFLCPTLCKLFQEKVDSCRLYAVCGVAMLLSKVSDILPYMPVVITAITHFFDSPSAFTASEQVKISILNLLRNVMDEMNKNSSISIIVPDCVNILVKSMSDTCPDVVLNTCHNIRMLALFAGPVIHKDVGTLLAAVLPYGSNRRATIRQAVASAIEALLLVNCENFRPVYDVLRKLAYDSVPFVRATVTGVAFTWLCRLRDRHSYCGEILYLLLLGIGDDVDEVSVGALSHIPELSKVYERDWPLRVKKILDFAGPDEHVGFALMVRDSAMLITNQATQDLGSFYNEQRRCGATVFNVLLNYSSSYVTGYIDNLLPVLGNALFEFDVDLRQKSLKCFESAGKCIELKVILDVLLPNVCKPCIRVGLTHVLKNAKPTSEDINRVLNELCSKGLEFTECKSIVNLYTMILHSLGTNAEGADLLLLLRIGVYQSKDKDIVKAIENSPLNLFLMADELLLQTIEKDKQSSNVVTRHSECVGLFQTMCKLCPDAVQNQIFEKSIVFFEMFNRVSNTDAELKLALLNCLRLKRAHLSIELAAKLIKPLITLMDWNGGKLPFELMQIASDIAQYCVSKICWLQPELIIDDAVAYINAVCWCIDDIQDGQTRCGVVQAMGLCIECFASRPKDFGAKPLTWSIVVNNLMHQAFRLMNDSKDFVREATCVLLEKMIKYIPQFPRDPADEPCDEPETFVLHILDQILIHADDNNPAVREGAHKVISMAYDKAALITGMRLSDATEKATCKHELVTLLERLRGNANDKTS